jgi:polyphosphate kinase
MSRNLDRRVEVLTPVYDPNLVARLQRVLASYLADNVKARELRSDGSYRRVRPAKGEAPLDAQRALLEGTLDTALLH